MAGFVSRNESSDRLLGTPPPRPSAWVEHLSLVADEEPSPLRPSPPNSPCGPITATFTDRWPSFRSTRAGYCPTAGRCAPPPTTPPSFATPRVGYRITKGVAGAASAKYRRGRRIAVTGCYANTDYAGVLLLPALPSELIIGHRLGKQPSG